MAKQKGGMKMTKKLKISSVTFTSDAFPIIKKILELDKNLKCTYCNKRIDKRNIGGILPNYKIMCKNFTCMLEAIKEKKV